MKHILVPSDFSFCAHLAADVAFELALKTDAHIRFYHKADFPSGWEELPVSKRKLNGDIYDRELEVIRQMEALMAQGKQKGVVCDYAYSSGSLITNLKNEILKRDFDIMVVGSHGASGKEEYFIGSNAQKIIRKVHIPVMVVKSPLTRLTFDKVMFATGLATTDLEAFGIFLKLIEPFSPQEIHIMAVDTSSYFSQPTIIMKEALKLFENKAMPYQTKTHFYRDYSVEAGIRHFSEEVGIQLIGISNRDRRPFKRMLQGSNVEMLVNHADVPVLSIDY